MTHLKNGKGNVDIKFLSQLLTEYETKEMLGIKQRSRLHLFRIVDFQSSSLRQRLITNLVFIYLRYEIDHLVICNKFTFMKKVEEVLRICTRDGFLTNFLVKENKNIEESLDIKLRISATCHGLDSYKNDQENKWITIYVIFRQDYKQF